jgi:hypothetical protein
MDQNQMNGKCNCNHHKVIPLLIALFGLLFLLRALDVFGQHTTDVIWPILVIAAGLTKMFSGMCRCCNCSK